jgi:hypothetical protein
MNNTVLSLSKTQKCIVVLLDVEQIEFCPRQPSITDVKKRVLNIGLLLILDFYCSWKDDFQTQKD